MQSDNCALKAVSLLAVKQPAVPKAMKPSSLPWGHAQGGDGEQTGDTVGVRLARKIFRVGEC